MKPDRDQRPGNAPLAGHVLDIIPFAFAFFLLAMALAGFLLDGRGA